MIIWYLVAILTPTFLSEDVEKIFVDRFASKEICESYIPAAEEELKNFSVKRLECRSDKVVERRRNGK